MALHWLHLSDIHFHPKDAWRDDRARQELLAFLQKRFDSGKLPRPDLIFCTGDIAFGETAKHPLAEQYAQAKTFFTELLAVCGCAKERLFVVPGNHDVNRSEIDEDAQAALINLAADSRNNASRINARLETQPNPFKNAMKRLSAYADFIADFLPHQYDKEGRCIYQHSLTINGTKVGIAGFNSAWSCAGPEDDRRIWLGAEWQFNRANAHMRDADLRIGLIHHPIDWLCEADRETAQQRIATEFDFWLFGHMHNAWVEPLASHVRIGAGALGSGTPDQFGINFVTLNDAGQTGRASLFQFRNGWTIHPIPAHADDGVWEFALPARLALRVGAPGSASGQALPAAPAAAPASELLLQRLDLINYRNHRRAQIDLHPQLTVLIAPNGKGKTGIIDALRMALQAFVARFDLADTASPQIAVTDIHTRLTKSGEIVPDLPCVVAAQAQLGAMLCEWSLHRKSQRAEDGYPANSEALNRLQDTADQLQTVVRNQPEAALLLPVIACYGTARLTGQHSLVAQETAHSDLFQRLYGYRGALDIGTNFQQFAAWFTWLCQVRNEELTKGTVTPALAASTRWGAMLKVIQQAINVTLRASTGWHTLDYSVQQQNSLVMSHDELGTLKVAQLSDGIRGILALVADVAWRCIKLNPHLGEQAAELATGIVLIDEVDMHLHPAWQQQVLQQLRTAFPKLQWIVTTHSPQILSCVPKECIRSIGDATEEGETLIEEPEWQTQGSSPEAVLAHVMAVNPIPDVAPVRNLNEYKRLIENGQQEEVAAQTLRAALLEHFGASHPAMLDCNRLMQLAEFKRRTAARRDSLAGTAAGAGHA